MMQRSQFLDVIYTHTEGEPTCIIHSGIPYPHGMDILGKRQYLQNNFDHSENRCPMHYGDNFFLCLGFLWCP